MYMMMACPIIHDDKFDHLIKVGVVGQKMTSRDIHIRSLEPMNVNHT